MQAHVRAYAFSFIGFYFGAVVVPWRAEFRTMPPVTARERKRERESNKKTQTLHSASEDWLL